MELNLLDENIGNILLDIGVHIGNYFLNKIPFAQELRSKFNKWNFIKLKKDFFSTAKKTIIERRGCPEHGWESLSTIYLT